jgi:lipid A 3-O-deacylase PagL
MRLACTRFSRSPKLVLFNFPLLFTAIFAGTTMSCTVSFCRAAEANLEVLPSWSGTGKVGYRAALQWGISGVIMLGGGAAYLPGDVVVVDLTPGLRVGKVGGFWAELGAGPAWSTSKTIDTRDIGSNFMFHDEVVVGYKWFYAGLTHYSNLYIRSPNMGANFVTLGARIPLGGKP